MTQLRLRFDPNCFDEDGYWCLVADEDSLESLEERGLMHDGDEVTIFYDDEAEDFEMQARLLRGGPGDVRWKARVISGTFLRRR